MVKKPNNNVFGMTGSPAVPGGEAASYKLWPVITYSNGYWEAYKLFQGNFLVWGWGWGEDLSLEEYVMGEEKFNEKGSGFSSITIKKKWKNKHEKVFSIESKE